MKVLINGEISFSGSEKEVLKYCQLLANGRVKTPIGKKIVRERSHTSWRCENEPLKLAQEQNYQPLRIEFIN